MSFVSSLKSKLGVDDDYADADLEELEKKKQGLEKKARLQQLKKEIDSLEGGRSGLLGKVEGAAKDLSKSGNNRALSILVGPPEDQRKTEAFVVGPSISERNDESVPSFLLGDNSPEKDQDIGISFPISEGSDEELEDIMNEPLEVRP